MEQVNLESLYPDTAWNTEIEELAGFIKNGTSCQLLSIPGAGRSTILGLLAHNSKVRLKHFGRDSAIHFVPVHFSEVKKRPLFDVMKFLFLSLADSLRARKMGEYGKVNNLFKESLGFKDELVLFQALKEAIDYLALERKLKIVFLFDRFEEYVPKVTAEFFTNLRTLRNRAKYQFSVVFSLNRPLEDLLEQDQLFDFYEFIAGHYVYSGLYDKSTTDFRVAYIEKITHKKILAKLIAEILIETGGVGRLIKLSVETVLSPQGAIDDKNFGDYLYSQKLIQSALMQICASLLPSEQAVLINDKFDDSAAVKYLETVGILKDKKIQIPLFERHIKSHVGKFKQSTKVIVFDDNTNSIKMGEVVLSDQLTSSEFRLLKFFLLNPERIVERDEMISVVWSSVKSTAGITDQAVDQLVFRLRRKIEDDPNNPVHLLTVKGRGFKFEG
ncbi:MAG TPA: helix-turn-helix domain-containing protein [Candidatus Saccharimonadales bacterium]|nr:helix-turn-helix domain-containing protein [Candidatus Saccharimonadales bacterium]